MVAERVAQSETKDCVLSRLPDDQDQRAVSLTGAIYTILEEKELDYDNDDHERDVQEP